MEFAPDQWPDVLTGSSPSSPSEASETGAEERGHDERQEEGLDLFGAIAPDDRPGEGSSPRPSGTHRRPSWWMRGLMVGFFLATHLALFGTFYLLVVRPSTAVPRTPAFDSTGRRVVARGRRPPSRGRDRPARPAGAVPMVAPRAEQPDSIPGPGSRKPSSSDWDGPERAG